MNFAMNMPITLTFFSFLLLLSLSSNGQDSGDFPPSGQSADISNDSPLGIRQQRIKRMVVELERQFTELARVLQKDYPEQSEKLVEAFKASKEMLLESRMDEITKLLNLSKLDTAGEKQEQAVDDVRKLIEFLLKEESEEDRVKEEIEKLEKWKEALDQLIDDENKLKDESDILADKDGALENLDAQIERLEKIIERQEKLKEVTGEEAAKGIDGLDRVADEQERARK